MRKAEESGDIVMHVGVDFVCSNHGVSNYKNVQDFLWQDL